MEDSRSAPVPYQSVLDRVALKQLGQHIEAANRAGQAARSGRGTDFGRVLEIGQQIALMVEHAQKAQAYWAAVASSAGASWRQIGDAAGLHRQVAFNRWRAMMQDRPLPDAG